MIKIVGCGNPLAGDDGAGLAVLNALPPIASRDVEVLDGGTGGLALLDLLEGAAAAILVDATEPAGTPGAVTVTDGSHWRNADAPMLSLHHLGVAEALAFGYHVQPDSVPPRVVVVGIEALDTAAGRLTLTPPVAAAVPRAVAAVLQTLAELTAGSPDRD